MKRGLRFRRACALALSLFCSVAWTGARSALADEGMWTFDNPPLRQLKERYNFTPTQAWLDRYKKYTDVRLVFAPEQQAAFFGGDPDNFTYPRYDLDMALFRVYENGRPVESKNYLRWNPRGAAEGELVFVSGHPGSTDRLDTLAQIETLRDYAYPQAIKTLNRRLQVLRGYASLGAEQARQAEGLIFSLENSLKAENGEYAGLRDPQVFAKKQEDERRFRALVMNNPEWKGSYGDAWDAVAAAEEKERGRFRELTFRSVRRSFSTLVDDAFTLVRYAAEVRKPDAERLDGFHESQLASLKFALFSPAPVYPQLEERLLADSLQESLEALGPDDPFIKQALDGHAPAEVAHSLIAGTRLAEPAVRRTLADGGEAAVAASDDPLLVFARRLDPMLREAREWVATNVEGVEASAGEKIGKARFAAYGKVIIP